MVTKELGNMAGSTTEFPLMEGLECLDSYTM